MSLCVFLLQHKYLMRRKLGGKDNDSEEEENNDSVLADIKQEPNDDENQDSPEKGQNFAANDPPHIYIYMVAILYMTPDEILQTKMYVDVPPGP